MQFQNVLKFFLVVFICGFSYQLSAQVFPANDFPRGYFRSPLNIPLQLSANFGELRTNHFHMGLDIRTNQRENLPVYATAEGYISRIKIERFGFGRVIYINHPNGYTTLYAHLNDFYDALNDYVIAKQYRDEQWEQDITFAPGQFPVKKGQFIANSGNTGGSAGPHLHFEIRNTQTGSNVNPWLFNFGLADNIPPYIYKLYYYDRRYSTYQSGPTEIPIQKTGSSYSSKSNVVVLNTPTLSLGIFAEDKANGSSFRFGIYQAELYIDDSLQSAFQLKDISYDETRYINAAIDYRTKQQGGPYIQHLSKLPGSRLNIFAPGADNGVIILNDSFEHKATIIVRDVAGNTTKLNFRFRYQPSLNREKMFTQDYIPMLPQQENKIEFPGIKAFFPANSFYHMVPFVYKASNPADKNAASAVHYLHSPEVPIHDSFTVALQVNENIPQSLRNKVVMQFVSKRKIEAMPGIWKGDWLEAKFRDFGTARLIVDTTPPTIQQSGWTNNSSVRGKSSIALLVRDNAGEIKNFRAELDGKWIMFKRKSDYFIHDFDNRTTSGSHTLKVMVEDEAGNVTERTYRFTR